VLFEREAGRPPGPVASELRQKLTTAHTLMTQAEYRPACRGNFWVISQTVRVQKINASKGKNLLSSEGALLFSSKNAPFWVRGQTGFARLTHRNVTKPTSK
jgi:hypothetical protein